MHRKIFDVTPEINKLGEIVRSKSTIKNELFLEHQVNRGLRDLKGNGVITGLTEVSDVHAFDMIDGVKTPRHGELFYRGINVEDITEGFMSEDRFGFEEVVYLLLFGKLPNKKELADFNELLATYRTMPQDFVKDVRRDLKKTFNNDDFEKEKAVSVPAGQCCLFFRCGCTVHCRRPVRRQRSTVQTYHGRCSPHRCSRRSG